MFNITLATDGACSGNPGPGGWGAILRCGNNKKEISGYDPWTTNNKMELLAVIKGISALKQPCNVTVRTDSTFVCNAISELDNMPKNKWRTKSGALRQNVDLLKQLYALKHDNGHEITSEYTKGHAGDEDNERCDTLAKTAIANGRTEAVGV